MVISSSQNICDCTYPTETLNAALTYASSTFILSNMITNVATSTPAITAMTASLVQPLQTVPLFNDIQATVACTPPAFLFLTNCPLDFSKPFGDPDEIIDLAGCVELNGFALTAP